MKNCSETISKDVYLEYKTISGTGLSLLRSSLGNEVFLDATIAFKIPMEQDLQKGNIKPLINPGYV